MEIIKANSNKHYDLSFKLMLDLTSSYIYKVLKMMDISLDEFKYMMMTLGDVYILNDHHQYVGFYWIETRDDRLHIHAICIESMYQNQGYGKYLMNDIFEHTKKDITMIELGVETNNKIAIGWYKKLGFNIERELEDLGFYIMTKPN